MVNIPTEIADVERREGRTALQSALGAKVCPIVGYALGSRYADGTTGAGDFIGFVILVPFLLLWFGLEVAGLVYGFGGRRTVTGRWAICLSGLSLLAGLAVVLILRQEAV